MQKTVLRFHRFFIDFSSQNRPWNDSPHELQERQQNSTENSCFFGLRRKFWPSGSIRAIPEGSKKSLLGCPESRSEKRSKTKTGFRARRRNARGLREVRRVKTLRVLQGSVRTLHQLWISAGIFCARLYASVLHAGRVRRI